MANEKIYGTENDVMFKCLFGAQENEAITKDFLEFITKEKIESINLDYKLEIEKQKPKDKELKTDLKAKDEKLRKYLMEMQNKTNNLLPKRFLSYLCRSYVADLKVANKYNMLKQTVLIVIMHHSFPNISKESNYHTVWKFREEKTGEVLSNDLQIHIIELPKYKKQKRETNIAEPWMEFLLDPFGKEVEKYMRTKKELEEAVKQLRMLNADDEVRELAEAQERAELDRNTELYLAKEEGLEEGRKEEKKSVARNLLEQGVDIEIIINATNLTVEEIENIKESKKRK